MIDITTLKPMAVQDARQQESFLLWYRQSCNNSEVLKGLQRGIFMEFYPKRGDRISECGVLDTP